MNKERAFRVAFLALLVSSLFRSSPFVYSYGKSDGSPGQAKKVPIEEFLKRIPSPESRWAENRQRDLRDRPEAILELLGINPGMRVGEAGAGDGYFTYFLSARVGESGVVYANDNDSYALAALEYYAKELFGGLKNIVPVLGADEDPLFPSPDLDMIVIYGSFHDFTRRAEWLRNAKRYLKSGGRLAIIDGYWPDHGALTKDVVGELGAQAGYHLVFYKDCSSEYDREDGGKGFFSHHVHILAKD